MTISPEQCDKLVNSVKDLAKKAGKCILDIYDNHFNIVEKSDQSPLTTADLASHKTIREGLSQLALQFPILSEEGESVPYPIRTQWTTYWLVDPLDGTREFIKGNGEFTVNIALIHKHDPMLGVVHVPVTGQTYSACRGQGAFREDPEKCAERIKVRSIKTDCPIIMGSRSHARKSLNTFLGKVGHYTLITKGSILKACLVAEGTADLYPRFGTTSEWDTAAAQCIVEEAGGSMTDFKMNKLRYNTKKSLDNPPFLAVGNHSYDWSVYL